MRPTYQQPEKKAIREKTLVHAVKVLTTGRRASTLVRLGELTELVQFAGTRLTEIGFSRLGLDRSVLVQLEAELASWTKLYRSHVGRKTPAQLKVLYLCGPEPLNDLQVLLSCGIDPHNVWAVESNKYNFETAIAQLNASGMPLKIHPGNLTDLLSTYPESFDIIYFDACGPFPKPATLDPLLKIFTLQRLQPLSVLITNFSEVPAETEDRFAAIFSAYFRYRYNDLPREFWASGLDPAELAYDATGFAAYIKGNITPFYSDFISRFITDLARQWIPSCRAVVTKEMFESFFQPRSLADQVLAKAQLLPENTTSMSDWFESVGDMRLSPDTYPLDSFFRTLKKELPADSLLNAINNLEIAGKKVAPLFGLVSLLEHIVEGHWDAASDRLLTAIKLSWFDQQQAFGCDLPMPNLLINSFSGVYGRPYHPNVRTSLRYQYKAKVNNMFTDLVVLDQCRYYYDWFPTVHTSPERFKSVGFQVLARCLMDLIGRNDHASKTHPFRGSAVACFGEHPSAKEHVLPLRRQI